MRNLRLRHLLIAGGVACAAIAVAAQPASAAPAPCAISKLVVWLPCPFGSQTTSLEIAQGAGAALAGCAATAIAAQATPPAMRRCLSRRFRIEASLPLHAGSR